MVLAAFFSCQGMDRLCGP